MSVKDIYDAHKREIFDKDNPIALENSRQCHKVFSEAIEAARLELGMTKNALASIADASPAQTYRVLGDENANLSMNTMQRFAGSVNKKVVIQVVDLDDTTYDAPTFTPTDTPIEPKAGEL